jgi:hypothetical protein
MGSKNDLKHKVDRKLYKNPVTEKEKKMAACLAESLESFGEKYSYGEFLRCTPILFRMQADKFNIHFSPSPGDE